VWHWTFDISEDTTDSQGYEANRQSLINHLRSSEHQLCMTSSEWTQLSSVILYCFKLRNAFRNLLLITRRGMQAVYQVGSRPHALELSMTHVHRRTGTSPVFTLLLSEVVCVSGKGSLPCKKAANRGGSRPSRRHALVLSMSHLCRGTTLGASTRNAPVLVAAPAAIRTAHALATTTCKLSAHLHSQ
jgi:hypothetical protein